MDFEPFKGGKFVDSELGLIPKGWSTGTIYSYIDVIYGAPYKSALFNDKKQGLPLIRIRDLKHTLLNIIQKKCYLIQNM